MTSILGSIHQLQDGSEVPWRSSVGRPRRPSAWCAPQHVPMGDPQVGLGCSALDFSDGLRFQDWISSKFNHLINLLPGNFDRHELFLVVSFGRCSLRLCSESVGLLLQSFIGGVTDLFRVLPLSDRVFRFSLSCKNVGFVVYRLRSYSCSVFKAYLHLWNSGGPNWIIEWQRFSEEESKSWKLVSHRRSSPVSFADIVRKPALSGANLVPLGRPNRPERSSLGLKQRHSVFDRISFPLRPTIDQACVVRSQFQKYSNYSIGRVASSGFRPSLRTSHVLPWAPRKLIWRPKKILEQCPRNFGQDSVPRLNGSADPVAMGHRHIWNLSLSGKISQIFGPSGQKCKRPFGSFPNKFAEAS